MVWKDGVLDIVDSLATQVDISPARQSVVGVSRMTTGLLTSAKRTRSRGSIRQEPPGRRRGTGARPRAETPVGVRRHDLEGKGIVDWFTRKSSVVYVVQNLFDRDKYHKTISLNVHYPVLFNNPRDKSQIEVLSRQLCLPSLLHGYEDAI